MMGIPDNMCQRVTYVIHFYHVLQFCQIMQTTRYILFDHKYIYCLTSATCVVLLSHIQAYHSNTTRKVLKTLPLGYIIFISYAGVLYYSVKNVKVLRTFLCYENGM